MPNSVGRNSKFSLGSLGPMRSGRRLEASRTCEVASAASASNWSRGCAQPGSGRKRQHGVDGPAGTLESGVAGGQLPCPTATDRYSTISDGQASKLASR